MLAAIPTFAFAAGTVAFSGEVPANGAVLTAPGALTVKVALTGSQAITASSQKVYVDGVQVVARQTYLTFVSGSSNTRANVLAYANVIGDGPHTIKVTVKNSSGETFTDSWDISIGLAPTLGAPTPADGTTVPSRSPVIEIPAADNVAVDHATATVNGVSAAALYSPATGKVSVAPGTLANGAVATVAVTVFDGGGLSATKTWSFTVMTFPEIASDVANCRDCHTGYENNPDMGPGCSNCHGGYSPVHSGSASSYHTTDTLDVSCSPCHVSALVAEHGRYAGVTCLTCHTSTAAAVKTAIATGDSSCAACHGATQAHATSDAPHAAAIAKCETSGCHTGSLASLHTTAKCATCHTADGVKSCATVGCHDTKLDASGNVLAHYFTSDGHTATSSLLAGQRYPGTDAAAMAGNGTLLNASYAWTAACSDCHAMALNTQHANPDSAGSCATCHKAGNTGAGDALKGGKWDKSCLAAGCHTADPNGGVPLAHLTNGQMDYSHSVASTLKALPGGCSATAGSGSWSGTDYARTACHYSDIIQEHNRKIESGPSGTVVQTISVTCAQCHSSAQFKALNGTWDGTCDACHDGTVLKNHSIAGTAENARVRGLHQTPSYYTSGTNSTQGMLIAGTNTMDAHGPLRTATVPAHPGAYKPIGCAQAFCHQNAYVKPGSGFYTATTCTQCHPANVAVANSPSGSMTLNGGATGTHSLAATINSAIVANGGATLVSMSVDPGTGIYGTAVAYSASYGITLPTGSGLKTVRVKYTDSAARVSTFTSMISYTPQTFVTNASVLGGNGTISPAGANALVGGSNQTFTFTPGADYKVGTLTVDGSPVSSPGTSYTFTNITAGHTIVVTFVKTVAMWSSGQPAEIGGATGDYVTGLTLNLASALPANSSLDFQTKYDIEDGWDFGYVQVSTDGGSTWTNLPGNLTTNANPFPYDGNIGGQKGNSGNGITGTSVGWVGAHFDLSAYSGQTVKLRLQYVCDWGYFGTGWNVNAITVGPTGSPVFTDDASSLKPEWSVTSSRAPGWTL